MNKPNQPCLSWEIVLQKPLKRLVRKHAGVTGADYAYLGIEFHAGEILNVSVPDQVFTLSEIDGLVEAEHDLAEGNLYSDLDGMYLKSVIYCLHVPANPQFLQYPQYFAVLDNGAYLTSYNCFNYTAFAFAYFREWKSSDMSRFAWERLRLTELQFFNAWDHSQIDPFSVYA